MKLKLIVAIVCLNFFWGHSMASDVPMVGLDKDGFPVEILMPQKRYRENLKQAIILIQTSGLSALQKKSENASGWMLRSAVFGIGVSAEVKLSKLKLALLPRFRIGFSNAKEPSVP